MANNNPDAPINNVPFGVNRNDPNRPILFPLNGVNICDPSPYFLQSFDFDNKSQSYQLNLQAAADLSKSYKWNGAFGTFAFGDKMRNAQKYNEPGDVYYNANDQASIPVNMFPVSNTDPNYYDKTYSLGYMPDFHAFRKFVLANPNLFSVDVHTTNSRNLPNQWDRVGSGRTRICRIPHEFAQLRQVPSLWRSTSRRHHRRQPRQPGPRQHHLTAEPECSTLCPAPK